ncbi:hypothetical protein [Phocaeicola coprocola]|uniref:hypothetical protein n=1 Tax=Phocaeicola coprocola TaxID=310298 RepID=UPI003AF1B663
MSKINKKYVLYSKSNSYSTIFPLLSAHESHNMLIIGFGYPDEAPAAKPREAAKVKFVE